MVAVLLAFASALSWGVADFAGGLQARRQPLLVVLLVAQAAGVVLSVVFVVASGDPPPELGAVAWAAAAGLAGQAALAAFYRGLSIGMMSIVAPVSATGAALPVLVGVAGGERPATLQVVGLALAMVGIVLAAREPTTGAAPAGASRTALGLSLVAALGFGAFFVGLDRATEAAGVAWTLSVTRAAELGGLLVVAAVLRPRLPAVAHDYAPLVAIGALDVLANALLAFATTRGLLSVVAVIASLYPAVTVLLARFVLHERVSRGQQAGVAVTLAGVVAISAG
jgi:drug/metabolite transporter (DMT)-like permease